VRRTGLASGLALAVRPAGSAEVSARKATLGRDHSGVGVTLDRLLSGVAACLFR
jgi:hypothetical protein